MKKLLVAIAIFLLASVVWSGPFGISMGMTLEQVREVTTSEPVQVVNGIWSITPLKTHPEIGAYLMFYQEEFGVTGVRAVSKDINTNSYGTQLLISVDSLTSLLSTAYGAPSKEYDFLLRGALWSGDHEYVMSLVNQERNCVKFWEKVDKNNITEIVLKVSASGRNTGYYILTYFFSNSETARQAEELKKSQVL